ncbi:hypothetical protein [Streptomyces sp. YGL11-2]|uniref:hypothetical protein n=1 Tax=Streptomyces sp. YGL11-2 TaxID=3414028 RepID=UPI003CED514E
MTTDARTEGRAAIDAYRQLQLLRIFPELMLGDSSAGRLQINLGRVGIGTAERLARALAEPGEEYQRPADTGPVYIVEGSDSGYHAVPTCARVGSRSRAVVVASRTKAEGAGRTPCLHCFRVEARR